MCVRHSFTLIIPAGASASSFGVANSNGTLEASADFEGNLQVYSVYQASSDIAEQRAALQEIYTALGGEYWSPAWKQIEGAAWVRAYASSLDPTGKLGVHHCNLAVC